MTNEQKKTRNAKIDAKSGFCQSTGVYYSKREAITLPQPDQPLDITTYIFSQQQKHAPPTQIALVDAPTGRTLSYETLRHNVKALAAALHALYGIRKRDVVFVVSPNSIHLPYIYFAVLSLGAILTMANPINTEAEIQRQVQDSKPVIVFTLPHLVQKLGLIRVPIVLIEGTESTNSFSSSSYLSTLLQSGGNNFLPPVDISQGDTATLLYSSGTTGKSKGVISTHRNYIAMIACNRVRYEEGSGSGNVYLCGIPMFHTYGFRFTLCSLEIGATVIVMPKFDIHEMLHYIHQYKISLLPTVPSVLAILAKSSAVAKYDLSSLRQIGLGGAPLGKDVMRHFSAKFPHIQLRQGYGMTETSAAVVFTNSNKENRHNETVGLLSAVVEAKVVDPVSAKSLPPNHRGELWLRGPTIMKGYFGNEEATLATLDLEGWLKTGDLCYIDEEGFVFIVDRLKDLIKYNAYQVAPAELEDLLVSHPEISEAAVIPYPDPVAGQIPMAYVVKNSDSKLCEKDVINFVAKQVASYKKIRRVAFVNSIPKNSSGKILKKDLIERIKSISRL